MATKAMATCTKCGVRRPTGETDPRRIRRPCADGELCRFIIAPRGPGDLLAMALDYFGITKPKWLKWQNWLRVNVFGLPAQKYCGRCFWRQEMLNNAWEWSYVRVAMLLSRLRIG